VVARGGYGFQERREKEHEVGVRSEAKEAVDFWLEALTGSFLWEKRLDLKVEKKSFEKLRSYLGKSRASV
jgi:hypothetical protein